MNIAQMILDLYPDFVNEYGLIGCGLFTATIASSIATLISWLRG
jgi:hypothetical protein